MSKQVELIVSVLAAEGKRDALQRELQDMLAPTHAESGLVFYRLYQSDTPGQFFFHELWESQEALDAHMKTPHFERLGPAIQDLLAKPLELYKVSEVG